MFTVFGRYLACSNESTDQQAIDTLLRLAEEYAGHGKSLANESHGTAKGAHDQDGLKNAEADLLVC